MPFRLAAKAQIDAAVFLVFRIATEFRTALFRGIYAHSWCKADAPSGNFESTGEKAF